MAVGAVLVWLAVLVLAWLATRRGERPIGARAARWLIVGAGAVFPTLVLAALLAYGLLRMPQLRADPSAAALQVDVSGEQWWWRVRYRLPDGRTVELANEIHMPVGEPVAFTLTSPDVIHSFWIPALGGKLDMIPGRSNRFVLRADRAGVYRGICAEYCGSAHAFMGFQVVAQPRAQFDDWLRAQARPAARVDDALAQRGERLFLQHGCGGCHTVRGSAANGPVGPDLTHVGSRLGIAAGMLGANAVQFERWINHAGALKPGVHMPSYAMLPAAEVSALAAYLEALQ